MVLHRGAEQVEQRRRGLSIQRAALHDERRIGTAADELVQLQQRLLHHDTGLCRRRLGHECRCFEWWQLKLRRDARWLELHHDLTQRGITCGDFVCRIGKVLLRSQREGQHADTGREMKRNRSSPSSAIAMSRFAMAFRKPSSAGPLDGLCQLGREGEAV